MITHSATNRVLFVVLAMVLMLALSVEGQGQCAAGTRPGCSDGSTPTCPDGSAPDSSTSPPCPNSQHPRCADGNNPTCVSTTNTGPAAPATGSKVCATDGTSSNVKFTVEGDNRVVISNSCPNHKWRKINPNDALAQPFLGASDSDYKFNLPAAPTLAPAGQEFNVECVGGPIGVARSGPMLFSPFPGTTCPGDAVALEGDTFDECAGHAAQRGDYHYHMTPICTLNSLGDNATRHSPILGYMADGIPIYGPRGANGGIPTDLDSCGGHASDDGNGGEYHYHFQPVTGKWPDPATPLTSANVGNVGPGYPYTAKCLKGCISDAIRASFPPGTTFPTLSYADCVAQGTKMKVAEFTKGDGFDNVSYAPSTSSASDVVAVSAIVVAIVVVLFA